MSIYLAELPRAESLSKNLAFEMGPFLRDERFRRSGYSKILLLSDSEANFQTTVGRTKRQLIWLSCLVLNPRAKISLLRWDPF